MEEYKLIDKALSVLSESDIDDPIAGWSSEVECGQFIASLIRLHGCKNVVELGVFKGLTSVLMANAAEKFTGIDIQDYRPDGIKDLFKKTKAKFIKGDSATEIAKFEDKSLDLVFVDSFHEFDHVMKEWKALEPKMVKGGLVVFHDSIHIVDVKRIINYIKRFAHFEVITFNTTGNRGLSVVKCLL